MCVRHVEQVRTEVTGLLEIHVKMHMSVFSDQFLMSLVYGSEAR